MKILKQNIWVNFLHWYQPPWQTKGIIEQVDSASYDYLCTLWERYPHWRTSLNINGSLIEQLAEHRPNTIKRLAALVKSGQIELTATAKYHPILPLLDKTEIIRQIQINQETLAKYFPTRNIKGFYLPEMAYSYEAAKVVKKLGYQWLILDQIHYPGAKLDKDVLYQIKGLGLKVVFRDRILSKQYPPRAIWHSLSTKKPDIFITATDGEIYGHYHEDWRGYIERLLQRRDLVAYTVSDYLKSMTKKQLIQPRAASWETKSKDLGKGLPYLFWQDPHNQIHNGLWQLVDLATKLVAKYRRDQNWFWARRHLDRGVSSCTFWWATGQKPSAFSPLTWNPDMIDNGSEELVKSIRSLSSATAREKIQAELIYIDIKKNTWLKHWRRYHR